ncbi:LysR family transcriptional regulator [Rhizobium mesoamericanum]|uniref:Putative LysR family transcriptional regulator n=1 Tax=Rhizobium mesoamericanum STM3625 TaxID=1211777 RepID=K0PXJ1_9HYPH|nr:LysR family transcriptional regulator [Rhizobium mesoamericanum]CCM76385.1 putative LysR family transcriptional regulator [Rhizobium mesoamericanum STM3625]
MDLSSIEIFQAVASTCSVTKAAAAVGRVPSNVTTRIQQLEENLGVALFSRDGKKMSLTREGMIFVSYATRLADLAEEARQAVRPLVASGVLRVGTMESTAASRLPDVIRRFGLLWPDVSLQLTMGATRELMQSVLAEELDCALVARPPEASLDKTRYADLDLSGFDARRIYVEDLILVLPPKHPDIKDARNLRVGTLAVMEPGCTYRRMAEEWVKDGASLRTLELGSYHAILASVVAGNAFAVMPRSVFDLLRWPADIVTCEIGAVETFLVRCNGGRSDSFEAFYDVLVASRGRDVLSLSRG